MKYPCLVPKRLCKTDISVVIEREGVNEYGEPLETVNYSGKCNYQDKARTVLTAEKKLIQITEKIEEKSPCRYPFVYRAIKIWAII